MEVVQIAKSNPVPDGVTEDFIGSLDLDSNGCSEVLSRVSTISVSRFF